MRVAVLGLGAIGTLVARTLDGRVALTCVDRTKAPLNGQVSTRTKFSTSPSASSSPR